jgi:hypothetical protein
MTGSPPARCRPGRRMVLVPHLGDQLLAPLAVLEELLVDLAGWEDEDAADAFPAGPALWLPAPLAGRVALGAVWRLRAALTPSQVRGLKRGRLRGPGGKECPPLSVGVLAEGDIAILSATARALGHPGLDADVAVLLKNSFQNDGELAVADEGAGQPE